MGARVPNQENRKIRLIPGCLEGCKINGWREAAVRAKDTSESRQMEEGGCWVATCQQALVTPSMGTASLGLISKTCSVKMYSLFLRSYYSFHVIQHVGFASNLDKIAKYSVISFCYLMSAQSVNVYCHCSYKENPNLHYSILLIFTFMFMLETHWRHGPNLTHAHCKTTK